MPDMQGAYEEIKDKDVNIVGFIEDGASAKDTAKKILSQQKVTYTNIIPDEKLYDDLISLVGSFPTSILVNDKGEIEKVIYPGDGKEVVRLGVLKKQQILDIFNEKLKK